MRIGCSSIRVCYDIVSDGFGENKEKCGALTEFRLHPDSPVMNLDDLPDNRQTGAGPFVLLTAMSRWKMTKIFSWNSLSIPMPLSLMEKRYELFSLFEIRAPRPVRPTC